MDACLKEAKRIEYEELYRKAWDAQRKNDAAIDPRVKLKEDEKKKGLLLFCQKIVRLVILIENLIDWREMEWMCTTFLLL